MKKSYRLAILSTLLIGVLFAGWRLNRVDVTVITGTGITGGVKKDAAQNTATSSQNQSPTGASLQQTTNQTENFTVVTESPHPQPDKKRANQVVAADGTTYPLRIYKPLLTPNDPSSSQWWVSQTGLPAAWDAGTGSQNTTVAVIDSGYALNHEELSNRWALNDGEQGATGNQAISKLNCSDSNLSLNESCNLIDDDFDGIVDNESGSTNIQNPSKRNCTDSGLPLDKSCNNVDDDNNGYVDDFRGWDFSNYDASVQAGEVNPNGSNTTHGTMVSGILGATGNNSKGIAGVNWQTKILPLQALDDDEYGDTLTVSRAVRYAADQDADVISLSLGSDLGDSYLRQAVQYALDRGSLVVAAAGNDGCDCISYPANYPEVIAVGASNPAGNPASFSNYGLNLDIMAPGQSMTSSSWSPNNGTSAYASNIAGTSFSTPYISGLLALLRSHQPQASWGELSGILMENAHHVDLVNSTRINHIGFGYVRANNAVTRATSTYSQDVRYALTGVRSTDTLSSSRAYQCESTGYGTSPVYQSVKSNQVKFTTSELQKVRDAASGWSVTHRGFVCVGLPTDIPSSIREISLPIEIYGSITPKSAL
jgi:subtilisin family serine protease